MPEVISAIKGRKKKAGKNKGKRPRKTQDAAAVKAAAIAPPGSPAEDGTQFIYAFVTGPVDRCRSQIIEHRPIVETACENCA